MSITAKLVEREDALTVIDEYGDEWQVFTDDGNGVYAVERDAPERWEAATFYDGEIHPAGEGKTFGVNCQDEFITQRIDNAGSLRWTENEAD